MNPVNKPCTETCHHLRFFSSQIWGGSFGRLEDPPTEDVTHTGFKWQKQDQNPGLLLPVIVLDAMRDPGPHTMVGVHLPGIPGLAGREITGTDFHTGRDVMHVRSVDITCRSVEGAAWVPRGSLYFNMAGNALRVV